VTRRQSPRPEPGRRLRPFHLPHLHRPRLPRWQQIVLGGFIVAGGVFLSLRHPDALRSTIDLLSPPIRTPGETLIADRPAEEAVLERRRQGLMALTQAAARGPLVSRDADRVLFLVDQSLVAALLATQVPREYVVEDTFRIWVTGARITFEDGLALVRLDARASLVGAEEEAFADVAVFGDLEILRQQPSAAVLRARINLIAVDARRVEVVGKRRDADKLVERLGKSRLSAFAKLASELEIPVRHEHAIEMPAVDDGPVRIEATTLPLRLTLVDAKAFRGKLWISMAASFGPAGPPPSVALPMMPIDPASPAAGEPPEQRVARLQHEVSQLRRRFLASADGDPLVQKGAAAEGHITAAVQPALFEDIVRRIAARYLDRVSVQLDGLNVNKTGEIHKDTLLGRIKAGDWTASIRFEHVRGMLRAGKPRIRLPGGNQVLVELPVHLERGSGQAHVNFEWDSHAVVNLVCGDFEVTQDVEGIVEHRDYPVAGQFIMAAGPDDLRALPSFDDRFRIHPLLDAESWAAIRRAIDDQDTFDRCGMGLDPQKVIEQLNHLVDAGFVVKLPRKLFRPVRLPTRLTPTVRVQERDVDVELTQSRLEAGPDGVWYGVWVKAGLPGPRGAGPGG
jgi:hypothetical protein